MVIDMDHMPPAGVLEDVQRIMPDVRQALDHAIADIVRTHHPTRTTFLAISHALMDMAACYAINKEGLSQRHFAHAAGVIYGERRGQLWPLPQWTSTGKSDAR